MEIHPNRIINVGIIGAGYGLTNLLPVLTSISDYKVISVATTFGTKANLGSESPFLRNILFTTPKELINNSDIELVVIASPPSTHEEYAIAALEAGKNIYCEKPVGLNSNSTRRILQASKRTKLVSTVGYQFRYNPMIKWLKDKVATGELGEINRVEIRWETSGASRTPPTSWRNQLKQGGGVLRDFGSHVFDYLSFMDPINFPQIFDKPGFEHSFRSNMPGEDIQDIDFSGMFGPIEFKCIISRTRIQPIGHDIRVLGSKAEAHVSHKPPFGIEDLALEIITKSGVHMDLTQAADQDPTSSEFSEKNSDVRKLSSRNLFVHLAHEIRGDASKNLPTLEQALSSQKLVDEAETILF